MTDPATPGPGTGDWTDFNTHDPGITIVQVLSYSVAALLGVAVLRRWRTRRSHPSQASRG